ncbi:MAG TPA: hypothetical protein VK184_03970 [Nostocaceae cyanobacterium]|nr:hypothetical protein [Nostocaceae cyanobacterium]
MIELGWFSAKLLFKGKLFRDPIYFLRQVVIATTLGTLLLVSLAQATIPLWIPLIASSVIIGVMMPFLLKDFKMK